MYKSGFNFYMIKYVFSIFLPIMLTFGFFTTLHSIPERDLNFFYAVYIPMFVFTAWVIYLAIKLRKFHTTNEGIIIREKGEDKLVPYSKINWTVEPIMTYKNLTVINYMDSDSISQSFFIIPSIQRSTFSFGFEENECTKYIKEKLSFHNERYDIDEAPPRWKGMLYFFLSTSIATIISFLVFRPIPY